MLARPPKVCRDDEPTLCIVGQHLQAYQILRKGGLPEENIVVMMADDIATYPGNPHPHQIFNRPGGVDVYEGVPVVSSLVPCNQVLGVSWGWCHLAYVPALLCFLQPVLMHLFLAAYINAVICWSGHATGDTTAKFKAFADFLAESNLTCRITEGQT